jgi:hypothetical protein
VVRDAGGGVGCMVADGVSVCECVCECVCVCVSVVVRE